MLVGTVPMGVAGALRGLPVGLGGRSSGCGASRRLLGAYRRAGILARMDFRRFIVRIGWGHGRNQKMNAACLGARVFNWEGLLWLFSQCCRI